MLNNLLDDLIQKPQKSGGVVAPDGLLDDLISTDTVTPPQGQALAPPAVAVNSGLGGGAAPRTVSGFQLPPVMDPFGINKPVDPEVQNLAQRYPAPAEPPGFFGRMGQSFGTGIEQGKTAISAITATAQDDLTKRTQQRLLALEAAGNGMSPEAEGLRKTLGFYQARQGRMMGDLAARQATMADQPIYPGVRALGEAESFGAAWDVLKQDPLNIIANLGAQSLPTMLPGLAVGLVNPVAGALTMGASGAGVELGSSLLQYAQENGINTRDPESLRQFYADPAKLDAAKTFAATRAGIIGTVDAASAGLASKMLVPRGMVNPVARAVTNTAVQIPTQAAAGAAGEAGAQLATEGRITSPGEVVAEGAGGLFTAPLEVASMATGAARARRDQPASPAVEPPTRPSGPLPVSERIEPTMDGLLDDLIPTPTNQPGAPDAIQVQGQEAAQAPTVLSQPASIDVPAAQAEPTPLVGNEGQQPAATPTDTQRVSTVTGRQVETRMRVVDASELQAATGELQPRDRSRASSDEQINAIAGQLDPQRLGESAEADRGAPIIGPDMIVESGNGRVMAIRRAFEMFPERAQAYRDYLAAQGYDTTGLAMPVLVRERVTPMDQQERVAFVQEANQSATMALSPVEMAQIDVSAMAPSVVEVWRGGAVTDAVNRDFVRAFVGQLPQAQRNSLMDANGMLSPDGAKRIERALLAAAYQDRELLNTLIDSQDNNIRSIGGALLDSAGQWLQMRGLARDGVIDAGYDVTADLVEAARVVNQLREQGSKVREWLAQSDLMSERNPTVDAFVTAFYNQDMTRAVGRDAINDVLRDYVTMASSQDTAGLFGDAPPAPTDMVKGAVEQRNERNKETVSGNLFDRAEPEGDADAGQGTQPRGRQAKPAVVQGGRAQPDGGRAKGPILDASDRGPAARQASQGSADPVQAGDVNERARRSDRDDASAGTQGGERGRQNNGREENQRVKGAQDQFRAASYTTRQSIYRDAFEGLGLDPAEMELRPPARQFEILSKGLKERFGLSVLAKSEQANIRESIDQLLDAYRNMQFMAHVLDLPNTAIGLNGTMGIALISKGKGFLGAYFPTGGSGKILENLQTSGPTIAMPGRSNSFAHEWGHALDYFIADKYQGAVSDLSGMVRKGESLSDQMPETVRDSFRLLMNALFFDNAELSGRIMDLERRIEAATLKGIDATKLKAELEQLQSGASQSPKGRSEFYKASGEFAIGQGGDPSYWRKPTEMLARSFEAYIAHRVEAGGGTTEFIAKGDDAYQSNADSRLRMTFPKDSDRYNIFRAYDLLFQAMRDEMLFGDGPMAQAPTGTKTDNRAIYFSPDKRLHPNWLVNWLMSNKEELQAVKLQEKAQAARPKDPRTTGKKVDDAAGFFAYSNRGVLLSMESDYRKNGNPAAAAAINEFRRRIATDPGSGRETFRGGVFAEAVERETKRYNNALGNIIKEHKVGLMEAKELAQLTQALTAPNVESLGLPAKVLAPAVAMRKLSNDMYYFLRRANMDVGFIKDQGYLPRLMDTPLVDGDPQGFARAASEVYQIVFERDTERPGDADDMVVALAALDKRIKEAGLSKDDPSLEAYMEAKKELAKLQRKLDAATRSEDSDQIDSAQADLRDFLDASMSIFEEAYDFVGPVWSSKAADDYLSRVLFGSVDEDEFSRHSPAGSFTKERVLPPEADRLLAPYYIQNPAERMQKYIGMAVRRAEYERRFGKVNDNADTTQYQDLKEGMKAAGVRADDQATILLIVKQVAGHLRTNSSKGALRTLSGLHALGSMAILGRVSITSLPETLLAPTQTGRPVSDTMRMLANAATQIVQTGTAKERSRMARTIGLVSDFMADEIIQNRLGGEVGESRGLMTRSSQFFQNVLLTPLTKAQRTIVMPQMMRYALDMANDVADAQESAAVRAIARAELIDMGLMDSEIDTFSQWAAQFQDRMPDVDEMMDSDGSLTDMGQALAVATNRLIGQTIQNPTAIDRQFMANTPYGRLVYALTSYLITMFRNVPIKLAKQIKRQYDTQGLTPAAGTALAYAAAPLVVFYAGTLAVTVMREAIFNQSQWEEEEEKEGGFPIKWLSLLALSRTGIIGMADPLFNAYMGIKYQRDLTALTAGPSITFVLSNLERISKLFLMNSENTTSAERAAVKASYELAAQPALAYTLGSMAGPYGWIGGLIYMFASSPSAKKAWTDAWFEEPAEKKAKTGGGQKESPL
jgi:hypothetical protein